MAGGGEDIFTVLVLVLLPAMFGNEAQDAGGVAWAVLSAVAKVGAPFVFAFVVGGARDPMAADAGRQDPFGELFTLTVLVLVWALR